MSSYDQKLWQAYTSDVMPLKQRPVPAPSAPTRAPHPHSVGPTLDLHGRTLAAAHATTLDYLAVARRHFRYVTIITGVSGAIRHEFRHWLAEHPDLRSITELPGGGAFRCTFRR